MDVRDTYARRTGTGVTGTEEVSIIVADNPVKIMLYSLKTLRATGASATARQPRIYTTASAAAGAFSEEFRSPAAVAPATLLYTVGIGTCIQLAAGAVLYMKIDGDVADTFDWVLWYKVLA